MTRLVKCMAILALVYVVLLCCFACTSPQLSSVAESIRLETGGGTFNGDGREGYRDVDLNGNTTFASISFAPFAALGLDRERRSNREFVEALYMRQVARADADDPASTPPPLTAVPVMDTVHPASGRVAEGAFRPTEDFTVGHAILVWAASVFAFGLLVAWLWRVLRVRVAVARRMECP